MLSTGETNKQTNFAGRKLRFKKKIRGEGVCICGAEEPVFREGGGIFLEPLFLTTSLERGYACHRGN